MGRFTQHGDGRHKLLRVSYELVLNAILPANGTRPGLDIEGLPGEGMSVVSVFHDPFSACFCFTLHHPSWDVVPAGQLPPEAQITIREQESAAASGGGELQLSLDRLYLWPMVGRINRSQFKTYAAGTLLLYSFDWDERIIYFTPPDKEPRDAVEFSGVQVLMDRGWRAQWVARGELVPLPKTLWLPNLPGSILKTVPVSRVKTVKLGDSVYHVEVRPGKPGEEIRLTNGRPLVYLGQQMYWSEDMQPTSTQPNEPTPESDPADPEAYGLLRTLFGLPVEWVDKLPEVDPPANPFAEKGTPLEGR